MSDSVRVFSAIFCRRGLLFLVLTIGCLSCKNKVDVVYEKPFEQVKTQAAETGKNFCVVLTRPDCPPCVTYVKDIGDGRYKDLPRDVVFNMVDTSQPENSWYAEWLCASGFPTTCVFSPEGQLKAVVAATTASAMQCLKSSVDGDAKCANYFYDRHYPVRGDYLSMLNNLLSCKQNLDAGKDIGDDIDAVLRQADYPYPVWLKCLNEERQGRHEEAVSWAQRLLQFDNVLYYYVYNDIFTKAKHIINPDYTPEQDALLSVAEEIRLDDCKVGEPRRFGIEVTNAGKFPLFVRDTKMSCTCLELLTPKQFRLAPGESTRVEVEFTAETKGEVYREVIFVSDPNSAEALKFVAIRASVR